MVESFFITVRNLIQKPVFEEGNALWVFDLPSVTTQNDITTHHSTKIIPVEASKKINKKTVFSIFKAKKNLIQNRN